MIIGFNLDKIAIERYAPLQGKVSVRNDIDIRDVKEQHLSEVKGVQKALAFTFVFTVAYTPHIADITIIGTVLYAAPQAKITELLSTWQSKKKVPSEVSLQVLNLVLQKCNIRALELAQELRLPPHIPLPQANLQQQATNAYIG